MGRYLAVHVRLAGPKFPTAMFDALSLSEHFRPAACAGIEGHQTGDHWFLSGYALEDFISRFAPQAPAPPASIDHVSAADGANASYLAQVAHRLQSGEPQLPLSPFEQLCANGRTTFLDDRRIDETEKCAAARWFKTHPGTLFYLYGAFALEVTPKIRASVRWDRAFREIDEGPDQIGPPYVLIRAGTDPLTKANIDVTLSSWSTVWFSSVGAFTVGPTEAEENRRRLASLVETVQRAESHRLVSSSLHVEGQPFVDHERQLRTLIRQLSQPS